MGTIIQFPETSRLARDSRSGGQHDDATIIILPSVRIERHIEAPGGDTNPTPTDRSRGRRGRGQR
jgi:hypothetical protein